MLALRNCALVQELKAYELLGTHPNLLPVQHAYEDSSFVYFLYEFFEGSELVVSWEAVRLFKTERRSVTYLEQLASVLEYCHDIGRMRLACNF